MCNALGNSKHNIHFLNHRGLPSWKLLKAGQAPVGRHSQSTPLRPARQLALFLLNQSFQSRLGMSVATQGFHEAASRLPQGLNALGVAALSSIGFPSHRHAWGSW